MVAEGPPNRVASGRPLGIAAVAFAVLLPLAFSPAVGAPFWSPRLALILCLVALGLPLLVCLALDARGWEARAGLAAAGLAAVCALASRRPALSLLGQYDGAGSALFVAAFGAAWALGRLAAPRRELIERALLLALAINVVVAATQSFVDLASYGLGITRGPYGLLGNPVHLGALIAGTSGVLLHRFRVRPARWIGPVVVSGAVLELSGSRLGTLAAVLVVALGSRSGWRSALAFGAIFFGAFLVAGVIVPHAPASSPILGAARDTSVASKLAQAHSTELLQRTDTWKTSISALADRPILGFGPGRFVEASSPRRTARVARGDPERVYVDAHNVVVEYLVTMGPIGFAVLLVFVALAGRGARGPLLLFAAGVAIVCMGEPQSLSLTPLTFLALGAANPPLPDSAARLPLAVPALMLLLGGVAAVVILFGDFELNQARLDARLAVARTADQLLSPWPQAAGRLAFTELVHATTDHTGVSHHDQLVREAIRDLRRAADRDPALASSWNNLADIELATGETDRATVDFTRALRANPWSVRALIALAAIDTAQSRTADANSRLDRAAHVLPRAQITRLLHDRATKAGAL